MKTSREQFEKEIKQRFGDLIDYRICKNGDGEYMAWDMQVAWWAWRASRAAIVVELPEKLTCRDCEEQGKSNDWGSGFDIGIHCSSAHIRAAGITVKGEE